MAFGFDTEIVDVAGDDVVVACLVDGAELAVDPRQAAAEPRRAERRRSPA